METLQVDIVYRWFQMFGKKVIGFPQQQTSFSDGTVAMVDGSDLVIRREDGEEESRLPIQGMERWPELSHFRGTIEGAGWSFQVRAKEFHTASLLTLEGKEYLLKDWMNEFACPAFSLCRGPRIHDSYYDMKVANPEAALVAKVVAAVHIHQRQKSASGADT